MALVQQQSMEYPFRTEDGDAVIDAPLHGPPSPISLQQWLKHWEDLLDNQVIAFSSRMNAVGLIERGRACHTIEKKWNQRQVILFC